MDFLQNEKEKIRQASLRYCAGCQSCDVSKMESVWDKEPQGCNLSGWLFSQREEIKQKVRKQKEELLDLNVFLSHNNEYADKKDEIEQRILRIQAFIEKYKKYGSIDW